MASKGQSRLAKADQIIEEQTEAIDQQLAVLDKMLEPYDRIKERRERLRKARSALLGGTGTTGAGTTKVRREDVRDFLIENPGATPGQLAEALHTTQTNISSHLHRGRDERFITDGESHWWIRDPKNGILTYDDIKEQEEDG